MKEWKKKVCAQKGFLPLQHNELDYIICNKSNNKYKQWDNHRNYSQYMDIGCSRNNRSDCELLFKCVASQLYGRGWTKWMKKAADTIVTNLLYSIKVCVLWSVKVYLVSQWKNPVFHWPQRLSLCECATRIFILFESFMFTTRSLILNVIRYFIPSKLYPHSLFSWMVSFCWKLEQVV